MIEKVDFGRFAAEADSLNLEQEVFVATRQSNAFKMTDHRIIVGRKGSGKTALEMEFSRNYLNRYNHLLSINAEAIRFRKLIEFYRTLEQTAGNIIELRKGMVNIWEYSILTGCMLELVNNKKIATGKLTKIHNFLRKEGLLKKRIYDLLVDTLENVFKIVLGKRGEATSDIIRSIDNFPLDNMDFEDAKDALYEILKDDKGILVTFDHIDRYFEVDARPYTNDEIEKYAIRNFLTGLVQAIYNISTSRLNNVIEFKVFLPEDKFQSIRFRDLDKIREFVFNIAWTAEELEEFIGRRIAHSLNIRGKKGELVCDKQSTWHKIFPRTITNKHIDNIPEQTERYLIRHTHYKPRDLQYYCNRAKKLFLSEKDSKDKIIPEDIIKRAVKEVTRDLVDNFFIEFAYDYPFLKRLLEQFRQAKNILSYEEEFYERLSKFKLKEADNLSITDLVDLLFKVGFVGGVVTCKEKNTFNEDIYMRKVKGKYYGFYFNYIDPTFKIQNCEQVAIHPMFYEYLLLTIDSNVIVD